MYITPIWMLIGDDDDMVIFRLQELPGQHLCHRTRDHTGPMTASDRFDGSWSDFWKFLAPWHDMMYGSQGVKCKGHDEISTFVIAFSSMKPFGLGLANETQTWSEKSMVSPTLGARHVFSIRIYMPYRRWTKYSNLEQRIGRHPLPQMSKLKNVCVICHAVGFDLFCPPVSTLARRKQLWNLGGAGDKVVQGLNNLSIYCMYTRSNCIMWLEGVLNLCVYHSSLTRWHASIFEDVF